jgi:hypothetical protein
MMEVPIRIRVVKINPIKQIIRHRIRRDDIILNTTHERQLQHSLRVRNIRYKNARRIYEIHIIPLPAVFGGDDFDAGGDFACHAGLSAGAGGFFLFEAGGAEGVEEGGFADVGEADYQGVGAGEGVAVGGEGAEEGEDVGC